jgi:hypothetical protein
MTLLLTLQSLQRDLETTARRTADRRVALIETYAEVAR